MLIIIDLNVRTEVHSHSVLHNTHVHIQVHLHPTYHLSCCLPIHFDHTSSLARVVGGLRSLESRRFFEIKLTLLRQVLLRMCSLVIVEQKFSQHSLLLDNTLVLSPTRLFGVFGENLFLFVCFVFSWAVLGKCKNQRNFTASGAVDGILLSQTCFLHVW